MLRPVQGDVVELARTADRDVASDNSDPDLSAWIRALRMVPASPVTEGDVLAWVEGPLRQFFPFEKFWGGYGSMSGGRIQMRSMISSGHTCEFLASREIPFDLKSHGCFTWWVYNRRPFILDKAGGRDEAGTHILPCASELETMERFSLGFVAAHGVVDPFVPAGTHIIFAGVPRTQPKRTLAALDLIAPVFHTLYLRTKQTVDSGIDLSALTDRQRELVDLAAAGLPDKAIASRLTISDSTVGNHFRAIYAKLGIRKRSQLITLLK